MKLVRSGNYSNILNYVLMHVGATLCFFVKPELGAVGIALALYFITGGLGWSVGIHRGLIHRSFKTYRWVENCLALLGALSGLGGPISSSRLHFVRDFCQSNQGIADSELPRNFWRNYLRSPFFCNSWLEPEINDSISEQLRQRTFFRWLEHRWVLMGAMATLLYSMGGLTYVAWGLFARVTVSANVFACFDYFCHSPNWGRQRFQLVGASCDGRNNWLVSLLTSGEGWHNNHHAMPTSPRMGVGRFEIDLGYAMICGMRWVGLVWDPVDPDNALKSNALPIPRNEPTDSTNDGKAS